MVLYNKEQALDFVNKYTTNSILFENGRPIFNLIIITDDPNLNKTLLAQYREGQITSEEVAELHGNGQNLQVFAVIREFYNDLRT